MAELYETSNKKYFHEKSLTTNFTLKKTLKQKILVVLSISLLLLCYLPESSAQTQNIDSDNDLSKQFLTSNTLQNSQLFSFTDIDLAIDTDNKNHIITVDNYSLIYNTFHENSWTEEIIDGPNHDCICNVSDSGISIIVDDLEGIHVSYITEDNALRYAYFDGLVWNKSLVTTGLDLYDSSVIVDSSNSIHIFYTKYQGLIHAKLDEDGWNFSTLYSEYKQEWSRYHKLGTISATLDHNQNIHLSYISIDYLTLHYGVFNGEAWNFTTFDTNYNVYYFTSIVIDSNNNPHIAYAGTANTDGNWFDMMMSPYVYYANFNGTNWLHSQLSPGSSPSLAIDSLDNLHLSFVSRNYNDDFATNQLHYASLQDDNWTKTKFEIPSTERLNFDNQGQMNAVAIDGLGNVHISYDGRIYNGDVDQLFLHKSMLYPDSDNDGIRDNTDICPGFDDSIDEDNDGTPDNCDDIVDSDYDGISNDNDQCPGFDDNNDFDNDSIPDGCDDSDGDGFFDNYDLCQGHDDLIDIDNDYIPDGCDSLIDSDYDGVSDEEDICEGGYDWEDIDNDGIPDYCDPVFNEELELEQQEGDTTTPDEEDTPGFTTVFTILAIIGALSIANIRKHN